MMTGLYWTADGTEHELTAATSGAAMNIADRNGAVRVAWNGEILRRIAGELIVIRPMNTVEAFAVSLRVQPALAEAPFALTAPTSRAPQGRQDRLFS